MKIQSKTEAASPVGNQPEGQALLRIIAQHPFLKGMTVQHLETLAASAMLKDFAAGELIFSSDDVANRFYLIREGKIALESARTDEESLLVQHIGAGDVLGWSWLFPPYYWHFSARAVEPTKAIFFYGTRLREQCEEDKVFGYELIKRMAQIVIERLQATRKQLLQLHHFKS
jgi:CRP/FNR family transcriptional regulator, cyclic AMP receptor protein